MLLVDTLFAIWLFLRSRGQKQKHFLEPSRVSNVLVEYLVIVHLALRSTDYSKLITDKPR
jgi:hypothetical protein